MAPTIAPRHARRLAWFLLALAAALPANRAHGQSGNAYVYLDGHDPYYVSGEFPRLTTPQWVGEPEVEAVVVLAIDDMRGHEKWEAYLRPILERLKQIDGRAPVSIMTCNLDPAHPHLQQWLREGLSLEVHTVDHPCPLLGKNDFAAAKSTYDRCVDLLSRVPGSRPVAFRTPCCDSLNTVSPRFFAEIFDKATPEGRFLTIDSSVFNLFTPADGALPREALFDSAGKERFRKYLPADRTFVNTIENYPYPYVIGRLCWEFPCMVPSDWSAQHLHRPNNPATVEDLQAALDATVAKQGVFNLVFHPHGWIRNDQVNRLIDHAVSKHGKKVKFLTFREAQARLDEHLLAGQPLRAADGRDNGVRLLDLNRDGWLDVVVGNAAKRVTRIWAPRERAWRETSFPAALVAEAGPDAAVDGGARFGILGAERRPVLLAMSNADRKAWQWEDASWKSWPALARLPDIAGEPVVATLAGADRGVRLRDVDGDGACELMVSNADRQAIFGWNEADGQGAWRPLPFGLPAGTALVDGAGRDAGLRFVDVDEDGRDDVLFSNENGYSLHLFDSPQLGWSRAALQGERANGQLVPPIVVQGANNGAWFHSRHLWVQNETTDRLPDLVDRRSFGELLRDVAPAAKSPEASLRAIRVRPGFVVELVAAEPLVRDPVAFDWSPDGRLWVAEMADYPLGVDGKPAGRIRVLEDSDRDGKYDKARVFLEGVAFPNGIMCWRDGAIVTSSPAIFFAADSDGDGKADVRKPLFTGFGEGNQQHRVNGLRWGLDNWVYCANGDSGGDILCVNTGIVQSIAGRDFRMLPDAGVLDPQTGQTQFLRERDDWGNWFGSNNANPMYHFVQEDHYLRRNPHAAPARVRVDVSTAPGASQVFPTSRTLPRFNDFNAANRFTSACSAMIYRDTLFGPEFVGNSFVSEPVHNLVHREIVRPAGATFTGSRPDDEQRTEFLASSDNWFRPTMLRVGPDGALWIADMYRQTIEHPEYIPQAMQAEVDLRAGHDRGRIYRVYPRGKRPRAFPELNPTDPAALTRALASDSGWTRDAAQRLLVQGAHRAAGPRLKEMARGDQGPLAALHALCALDGLESLDDETLLVALSSPHAGVRRHAVRLAEPRLDRSGRLARTVEALVADDDAHVRMQVAYALGETNRAPAAKALAALIRNNRQDADILAAAVSSLNEDNLAACVDALLQMAGETPVDLVQVLLEQAVAWESEAALVELLNLTRGDRLGQDLQPKLEILASLLDAMERQGLTLDEFRQGASPATLESLAAVATLFRSARQVADDGNADAPVRVAAIRLLARETADAVADDVRLLAGLFSPRNAAEVQAAAVDRLGRVPGLESAHGLLAAWPGLGPELRSLVLDALLAQPGWSDVLVDELKAGSVLPSEIDASRRQRLLDLRGDNPDLADLLAGGIDKNRQRVVDEYRAALGRLTGDAEAGSAVFKQRCAACHRLENVGHAIGPDLAALTDRSRDALLAAMFDPNRAVEAKFVNYNVQTMAGLIHTGMIVAETGNSIALTAAEAKQTTLLRSEIETLASSAKSLMPEGLEKDVAPQNAADLLAYLARTRPPRKTFVGNEPAVVEPEGFRGEYWLLAANCEIHGSTLVFEPKCQNLGFWGSANDHAVWQIEAAQRGAFAVSIEYACPQDGGGNAFVLDVAGQRLTGKSQGKGSWDTYRSFSLGTVVLEPGQHEIVLRSDGPPREFLFDLKAVRLTPRD